MAIEDVSFYNLMGEEISGGSLVEQMINYYNLKLEAGETRVTDFNEGSEIRNLLEAFAVDLYNLMEEQNELTGIGFIETAEGEWLDKHGANPFIKLPRDTGMEANGYVTFSIPSEITEDVIIEDGTVVSAEEEGLDFITTGEARISAGETSVTVAVTCLTTGSEGNVDIGHINVINDDYINIQGLSVSNDAKLEHGTDYEEDEEYKQRLLNYIRQDDFGSIDYYLRLGKTVDGVHDIALIDDEVYTKKVLVNGYTKPVSDEIVANVLEVFTDTNNIIIGHNFTVDKPILHNVSLTLNLTVTQLINEDDIRNLLHDIFDGGANIVGIEYEGYYIGERLRKYILTDAITVFDEITDILIIDNNAGGELEDIIINENEVLNLNSLTINQTIGE